VGLTFCRDVSAADWLIGTGLPWVRLVTLGPPGFEAYGRLRQLPDPTRPGQSENDVDTDVDRAGPDQLATLLGVLGSWTSTPDDCWFCVWDGYGTVADGDDVDSGDPAAYVHDAAARPAAARPGRAPGWGAYQPLGGPESRGLPTVDVPNRSYWLFRGPLAEVGAWDRARGWPASHRLDGAEPAFVWPGDRAWCVAKDVDPHWAGIGGSAALVAALVGDPRLDVVPADPTEEQPHYR
jgi:hypothetical protein